MALITANGIGVVEADFVLPISRAWVVDMTVSGSDPSKLNGQVTIDIADGTLQLKGTASVEDVFLDTVRARVVAGAGGLGKSASPKHYRQVSAKIVLQDLLAAAGESMSSTADAKVLGAVLNSWTVSKMPVADAIALLMRQLGASWRMLADGTFWCGSESWSDSGLSFTIEHDDKAHSQLVITSESPLLLPGMSIGGRNVSYVEHHVDAKSVRSIIWVTTPSSYDRMRDPQVAMARSARPELDFYALYRARVAAQSADLLTVDLVPDDARLPPAGFQAIALRHGLPGCKVQVPSGAWVLIGWQNGDPAKPFCGLWEGGESPQRIQIGGNTDAARKNDPAGGGTLQFTFGPGSGGATLAIVYTPGDGSSPQFLPAGSGTLTIKEKITAGSNVVGLG